MMSAQQSPLTSVRAMPAARGSSPSENRVEHGVAEFLVRVADQLPAHGTQHSATQPSATGTPFTTQQQEQLNRLQSASVGYPHIPGRPAPLPPLAWTDSLRRLGAAVTVQWLVQDPDYATNGIWTVVPVLEALAARPGLRPSIGRIAQGLTIAASHTQKTDLAQEIAAGAHVLTASLHLADGDTMDAIPALLAAARLPYTSSARPASLRLYEIATARRDLRLQVVALTLAHLETAFADSASQVLDAKLEHLYWQYSSIRGVVPDVAGDGQIADLPLPTTSTSFDAYLDRQWTALYERGFPVSRSTAQPKRVVVVEYATGMRCGSCNWLDHAYHPLSRRYAADVVVPLAYHANAIIAPPAEADWDRWFAWYPIYAQNPNFRFNYRGRTTSQIPQRTLVTPAGDTLTNEFVDGHGLPADPRSHDRPIGQSLYQRAVARIDTELQRAPEARVRMTVAQRGDNIDVVTSVDSVQGTHHQLALRVVLFEDTVWVRQGTTRRLYLNVVRSAAQTDSLALGLPLRIVPNISPTVVRHSFNVAALHAALLEWRDPEALMERIPQLTRENAREWANDFQRQHPDARDFSIDRSRLHVIAFVQDLETGDILQSAVMKVPADGRPIPE